jgi:hypothetical protein
LILIKNNLKQETFNGLNDTFLSMSQEIGRILLP